jgi:hypothetical protein
VPDKLHRSSSSVQHSVALLAPLTGGGCRCPKVQRSLGPQTLLLYLCRWNTKELVDQSEKNDKKTCGTRIAHPKHTRKHEGTQSTQSNSTIRVVCTEEKRNGNGRLGNIETKELTVGESKKREKKKSVALLARSTGVGALRFNVESLEPQTILLCLRRLHTQELVDQSDKMKRKHVKHESHI